MRKSKKAKNKAKNERKVKQRKGENYDVCEFWRIYKQEES